MSSAAASSSSSTSQENHQGAECKNCGVQRSDFAVRQVPQSSLLFQGLPENGKFEHNVSLVEHESNFTIRDLLDVAEGRPRGVKAHTMYRIKDGYQWSMGIAIYETEYQVKLDDPADEPSSLHGHFMTDNEFFTECFHYDGGLNNPRNVPPIRTSNFLLMDYEEKPDNLRDHPVFCDEDLQGEENLRVLDTVDQLFPHGLPQPTYRVHIGKVPQIRFGDRVLVTEVQSPVMQQLVWIKVWSLTPFDMLTGHVINKPVAVCSGDDEPNHIDSSDNIKLLKPGELIAFPVTHVLGVIHGDHW